jgi:hypothetical protein
MRDIYLSFKRVVVWLGETSNAQTALEFCKKLKQNGGSVSGISNAQFQTGLDACYNLFIERAWWKRRWILQEILHDRPVKVHIGIIQIGLDELCQYFEVYDSSKTVWEIKNPSKAAIFKTRKELGGFAPINVLFSAIESPLR